MRVLPLALVVALAAIQYSACVGEDDDDARARAQLGRALLRRARDIQDHKSTAKEAEDERIKQIDAAEDIFVGSGYHGESSGSRRDETPKAGDGDDGASGSAEDDDDQSDDNDNSTSDDVSSDKKSSGDDASAESGSDESSTTDENANKRDLVTSGEASGNDEGSSTDDESDAAASASSASGASDEAGSSEKPADSDASGAADQQQETTGQNIIRVNEAKTDDKSTEAKNTAEESLSKKSEIAEVSGDTAVDTAAESSGSDNTADSSAETSSTTEEDENSSEAIRKGMESLSRLLKPVASSMDFEIFSGNSKPKTEDEDEEKAAQIKAEAEGESEKAEEVKPFHPVVVKLKKCKKVCAIPMTYDQCANPRCGLKMGSIKDACIWLCKNQVPHCHEQCTEE